MLPHCSWTETPLGSRCDVRCFREGFLSFWFPSPRGCQNERAGDELRSFASAPFMRYNSSEMPNFTRRMNPRRQVEHIRNCELYVLVHNTYVNVQLVQPHNAPPVRVLRLYTLVVRKTACSERFCSDGALHNSICDFRAPQNGLAG